MNDEIEPRRVATRSRMGSRTLLVGVLLAVSTHAAAQDEDFDRDDFGDEEPSSGTGTGGGNRAPQLVLRGYSGTLCPPDTANFSASSDGGLTWKLASDQHSSTTDVDTSCHLEIDLIVPAGARFRNPYFCPSIYAAMEEGGLQAASQIRFDYRSPAGAESFTETIEPQPGIDGDFDQAFCKMVNMTTPECVDPSQPTTLRLTVDISARSKPGTYLQLSALDGEFAESQGVQWTTCEGGF